MAIEKSLGQAPLGAGEIDDEELEGEVIVVELESDEDDISDLIEEAREMMSFEDNLAEELDDTELETLSGELIGLVEADVDSRKEWADIYVKGLDLIGFKHEERTEPWQNACGVHSNVLAEAAIRFQAETMSETFPAAGPVKTKILGMETKEKEEAAERVRADMNYELTENMVEYRPEHERMLYSLGLAGSAFKKVYYDTTAKRQCALYIPAEDVVVPYGASNLESAERVTHVMRKTKNELYKMQANGFYRDVELGEPVAFHTDIQKRKAQEGGYSVTDDDRYALYEIHANLVIDGVDDEDDLAKPYVVTLELNTGKVLSIYRNWDEEDDLQVKREHFVHYNYVPGFGFYGLGLIHIIGGYAKAGTSLIRQLVDAGTLSNLPGGLKARGLRIKGDDTPIEPGEWKDVDVPSGAIRDNIMPLPYKEPSQVLLALLDKITTEGRRLGAISDMNISDMSANAPVGTTLALLERTLKPMAAVQARVHYSMKQEFKLLKAIMAEYAPAEYGYLPVRGEVSARQSDYAMVDVIPVSDPNNTTMAQRVVQYQTVLQMSEKAPQIYDLPQLHRQMIEVLGIKNAEKIVPTREDATPVDPISENMNALVGKPMRAFIYQDHEAHITAHKSFLEDPMVAQMIGQNPQAKQIMASLQAHIAEHLGFSYRKQMEEKLGAGLPPPNERLPEEVEVNLARLIASAGQQVTAENKQKQAQQQAAEQQKDPVIQMQQQELKIKEQEVQRKIQKDQADTQLKQAELQRKTQKDQMDTMVDNAQIQLDERELALTAQKEGVRLNADTRKAQTQLELDLLKLAAAEQKDRNKK